MRNSFRNRKVIIITAGVLLFGGVLGSLYFFTNSDESRSSVYAAYEQAVHTSIEASHLPAAPNNPLRIALSDTLAQVLSEDTGVDRRKELAQGGLDLLQGIEKQIDIMGVSKEDVEASLAELESHMSHTLIPGLGRNRDLATLTNEQLRIISDIRGYSYRANYHTAEIFDQILEDGGLLTREHIIALNEQVPKVEEQFDQRANLYVELERVSQEIDTILDSLQN